jgi:tetratricopeptide (TPR) repeat protein
MDFIAYARLQLAQDRQVEAALARASASSERTIVEARYVLERGAWADAASLAPARPTPLDEVTIRFVRALGAARAGQAAAARTELSRLRALRGPVLRTEGEYWAGLVDVYAAAADAWLASAEGRSDQAGTMMEAAAALDDGREKHILLENKLVPQRELLGDLHLQSGRPAQALAAYEASLQAAPNRFRSYLGAARAAHALGRTEDARRWAGKLVDLIGPEESVRAEIAEARSLLAE